MSSILLFYRAGQQQPEADERLPNNADRPGIGPAHCGGHGDAGGVQAAGQGLEQDEGAQDPKEGGDERLVP